MNLLCRSVTSWSSHRISYHCDLWAVLIILDALWINIYMDDTTQIEPDGLLFLWPFWGVDLNNCRITHLVIH